MTWFGGVLVGVARKWPPAHLICLGLVGTFHFLHAKPVNFITPPPPPKSLVTTYFTAAIKPPL
jgi:hypothetical protein